LLSFLVRTELLKQKDRQYRILISETLNYQAVVEITVLTEELTFTNGRKSLTTKTGKIIATPGSELLSQTL